METDGIYRSCLYCEKPLAPEEWCNCGLETQPDKWPKHVSLPKVTITGPSTAPEAVIQAARTRT